MVQKIQMSGWKELEPDIVIENIDCLFRQVSNSPKLSSRWGIINRLQRLIRYSTTNPAIIFSLGCLSDIYEHVGENNEEVLHVKRKE